jgi:lipid-binding SYLF domain-containing protein
MRRSMRVIAIALGAGFLSIWAASPSFAQSDQRRLVSAATLTLSNFLNDSDMTWLHRNLGRARAVLIAPRITKAGFIFGGSGGRAVVFARDQKTGKWVGPAFYTLVTASVGFQAGVSFSEMVTLVMTDKGLNTLLSDSFKMGGDAAVAAGPIGAGAQSNLVADFISFSRSQGIYGGLNLDGTIASTSDEWNRLYYGRPARAPDILIKNSVRNKQSSELQNLLAVGSRKP